jgi:CheY-like chemotaxis protein
MLEQTFPKTIAVKLRLDAQNDVVFADRTQIHQALLNFCVNARDAMPRGGTLSITTETLENAEVRLHFPTADKQHYVCISIEDTGTGMDEVTRSRIFEPFFTTKGKGKGTGLGLAVVYGIVNSHHGHIEVDSVIGRGTTFRVYLPALMMGEGVSTAHHEKAEEIAGGDEIVLVAEDEEMLRELLRVLLEGKGYTVLLAADGEEAVRIYSEYRETVALVVTDLGLPKLGGWEAFQKMRTMNPNVKAIVASGYLEPMLRSEIFDAGVKGFVQKPYRPDELLKRVREVLDVKK